MERRENANRRAWLVVGSILFVVGLAIHPPPGPTLSEFMAIVAEQPTRWITAHWATAIALSVFAIVGLLVLTARSRLTENWWTVSAWAALVVSSLWVTTAAVTEATVGTATAVGGDTATFETWQTFAQAFSMGFVPLALAIAVIAGNEARAAHETTPVWASWLGTVAAVVAVAGYVLGVGLGIALGGPLWLTASVVMGLWMLWFGVALMRPGAVDPTRSEGALT